MASKNTLEGRETPIAFLEKVVDPTERDEFLKEANLGLGNYNDGLFYQQIDSFKHHLFGEALFGEGKTVRRGVADVQYALADEAWQKMTQAERRKALALDEEEIRGARDRRSRRAWYEENGRELWGELIEQGLEAVEGEDLKEFERIKRRLKILEEAAEIDGEFVDPFGRMILARHEASRSRNAHLIDSITGRVKELFQKDSDKQKKGIRGRLK